MFQKHLTIQSMLSIMKKEKLALKQLDNLLLIRVIKGFHGYLLSFVRGVARAI